MSPWKRLGVLLATLPAIIITTLIEVAICFSTGALVMLQLMSGLGRQHPRAVLGLALLTAIGTHVWIVFNHKIRDYIKSRSTE
jgi:succinate dehydrogenase hydrophobic anchor subunit